jgi:ankyrin repeat protein
LTFFKNIKQLILKNNKKRFIVVGYTMFVKKQLIYICFGLLYWQSNYSSNELTAAFIGSKDPFCFFAGTLTGGFAINHALNNRESLNSKKVVLCGLGLYVAGVSSAIIQDHIPGFIKNIGMKFGLSMTSNKSSVSLSTMVGGAGLGLALGTAWWMLEDNARSFRFLHAITSDHCEYNTHIVDKYLRKNLNPNATDRNNNSALILAVMHRKRDIVDKLLNSRADLNLANKNGDTALMAACSINDYGLGLRLINAGADINLENNQGETAFTIADQQKNTDLCNLLFSKKANPGRRYFDFISAISTGDIHIVANALETETISDLVKNQALIVASMHGKNEIIKLLLDHKANICTVDSEGKLAEDIAREKGFDETAQILSERGNISQQCLVCFDELAVKNFPQLHCGHRGTCKDCMKEVVQNSITARSTEHLTCTARDCTNKRLNVIDLRSIYRDTEEFKNVCERIADIQTQEWIRSQPNAKYCPAPDCGNAFLAGKNRQTVRCGACKFQYCSECLVEHHNKWTCAQAKEVRESANKSPEAAATARFLADMTRPCPTCNTPTEQISGCNHMTCIVKSCKSHFCFNCGKKLREPFYRGTGLDGTLLCGCRTWPRATQQSDA